MAIKKLEIMSKITFLFLWMLILAFSVSYSRDGVLDASFDEDGKPCLHFIGYSESKFGGVLVQTDDKIIVRANFSEVYLSSYYPRTFLLKYNSRLLEQSEFSSFKNGFMFYPNQIKENGVSVDFNLGQTDDLSIDLYDLDGKLIKQLIKKQTFSLVVIS